MITIGKGKRYDSRVGGKQAANALVREIREVAFPRENTIAWPPLRVARIILGFP